MSEAVNLRTRLRTRLHTHDDSGKTPTKKARITRIRAYRIYYCHAALMA